MKKLSSELFFEHVFAFFFFAARSNLLGDMDFLGDMDPFLVETSETGVATLTYLWLNLFQKYEKFVRNGTKEGIFQVFPAP